MDGIIVLVLIGWLIKFASSQKKKKQGRYSAAKKRPVSFPQQTPFDAVIETEPVFSSAIRDAAPAEGEGYSADWTGSMSIDSTEGEDLCDPSLGHEREIVSDRQSVYAGEIGREPLVDTSPHGLIQGVIMSEVLTRPAHRKYR